MESKSLIEVNHAISSAFLEINETQARLEQALTNVEETRDELKTLRAKATAAFIDALAHFKNCPTDTSNEIFHGICRLAEDAGFEPIAEQLREMNADK